MSVLSVGIYIDRPIKYSTESDLVYIRLFHGRFLKGEKYPTISSKCINRIRALNFFRFTKLRKLIIKFPFLQKKYEYQNHELTLNNF